MNKMRAYFRAFFLCVALALGVFAAMISNLFPGDRLRRNMVVRRWFTYVARIILGLRIERTGAPSKAPALYVSNHRSFIDPLVELMFVDALPLAKAEVGDYPLLGFGTRITGILLVERESHRSRLNVRGEMTRTLEDKRSILLYPEGTTNIGVEVMPFKNGGFKIAYGMGVPIIPMAIEFEDESDHWSDLPLLDQYIVQFGKRRTRCKLIFGTPLEGESAQDIKSKAEDWVNAQLKRFRAAFDAI